MCYGKNMANRSTNKSGKNTLVTAFILGTIITLVTGVWEYELTTNIMILEGSTGKIRGLPLPYWGEVSLNKYGFDYLFLFLDVVLWSIISFVILKLLKKFR